MWFGNKCFFHKQSLPRLHLGCTTGGPPPTGNGVENSQPIPPTVDNLDDKKNSPRAKNKTSLKRALPKGLSQGLSLFLCPYKETFYPSGIESLMTLEFALLGGVFIPYLHHSQSGTVARPPLSLEEACRRRASF